MDELLGWVCFCEEMYLYICYIKFYPYLELKWPLFLKVNTTKTWHFPKKHGSFGFQVHIGMSHQEKIGTSLQTGCIAPGVSPSPERQGTFTNPKVFWRSSLSLSLSLRSTKIRKWCWNERALKNHYLVSFVFEWLTHTCWEWLGFYRAVLFHTSSWGTTGWFEIRMVSQVEVQQGVSISIVYSRENMQP